jgi:hypothetical protein
MIELAQAANLPAGFWSSRRSSFDAIRAAAPAFTIRMEQQDLPQ